MVADCGATCAKYLLCLFNFAFFMVGSAVLCIGIWLAVAKESFINLTRISTTSFNGGVKNDIKLTLEELTEPSVIEQGAYILIAAGAFIFIISFLGYCGAVKENRVLLTAYGIFIIIVFVLQIALTVLCAIYSSKAQHHSKGFLKTTLSMYCTIGENKDAVSLSWDLVMAHMSCCGVEGSGDFRTAKLFVQKSSAEGLGRQVPESCCVLTGDPLLLTPAHPACITSPSQHNSYSQVGCYNRFSSMVSRNTDMVIGVVVVLAAIQLLAIIFSFCLCRAVGQERNYNHYKY